MTDLAGNPGGVRRGDPTMTAWMRCPCGWQGRRDHSLHQPCPDCGGPVEFSPVQGALLAVVLRERFGDDAAPPPEPARPKRGTRRQRDRTPLPAFGNRTETRPRYAKGRTLKELLDEWP